MATTGGNSSDAEFPWLPERSGTGLLHRMHERLSLWRYLDVDEPWIWADLEERAPEEARLQELIQNLRKKGVIERVGEREQGEDDRISHPSAEWRWRKGVVGELEQYHDDATRFEDLFGHAGCGHKVHIHNRRGAGLGCQYCEVDRDYPSGPIAEALGVER